MSHQNNPSVSITNSTTSFSMPTTFSSPIKQEFPNNLISLQQHPDFCEIPRDISNSSLDRRRSSGSITLLSNYEDSRHDLIKDGESSGHYSSFGAQNNKIVPSNMRLSQGNNSINTKNCNQVGGFIIPKEEQQCGNTSVPDKEKQKQTKKENTSVGFGGIEEKPIHECDACGKRLCSSRSLKRHKSTCKKVKAEIEQNQDSGGFIVSPPLSKPVTENISESKMNEQIVQKKIQIQRNSTGNLIFSDNKNENANLNQPIIRQCSSEYLSTQQPFCLAQPPPQNCSSSSSFASNNNSPIKFCNIMDPQGGGLSSPPIQQQQQHFYSKQPSYSSSAQIQVLQQETYFNKKDGEKVIPITASDEQPNKVSDVVDSVVAKLRLQSGGGGGVLNTRPPITTNCITNSCNISTATNPQLQYLPQQKHFNVPVEWNEGNISLQQQQQLGESNQQSTHFTMFYSNSQQQQNFQQQRQQYFAGDNSTRTTEILPTQQNNQLNNNQNEPTKFSQSKSSTSMTLQQNSWQPINSQQLIHQQPQPVGLHRHSSGGSDNINLMSPTLSSEETPIISGRIGQQNEKLTNSFNEQIKSQQLNEPSIKNTLTETDKLPPTSISLKSTVLSSPPHIQQQQRPRANSGNTNKNVYRYLCPECDKPYSCRKNVKRHRISQHKVPSQEAQDGQIKRIRLNEEDLQKDENIKKQSNASKSKEIIKKEEIDKEQKNLKEKELKREEMSRQNSSTSLKSPPINHQNILQSPDYHFQQQPSFPPSMQKQQNFQKQTSIQNLRDERQFQHHQGQRHPYYFQYPPVNQPQQEQRFVGQQHIDEAQNTFYEIPQHQIVQQPQQYIQGQQQQYHYHQQQQQLIYQDPQQQQKKFNQQQQYYGSQIITYPPPPLPTQQSSFQQQTNQQQQKIIMVQQQCTHQNNSEIGYNIQQQPGPSNRSNYYCNNNQYSSNNTYPQQYTMAANNNEYPITYQEGYYQQVEQQQRQQYAPQPITYNNNTNTYSDTLDCWEQIKPDVDTGHTVVDPDAMARIVADLKQTEEVTEKHNQQARIVQQQTIKRQQKEQQNNLQYCHLDNGMIVSSDNIDTTTGMFNQQSGIQRKAVELAEADTTFSPPSQPDDSLSRQISQKSHQGVGTQQFPQKIIPLNHQLQPTQQSPTTYQPIMSASNTSRQQQNVFRFDINNSSIPPKELNSIEHEKFHQIEWNYQGGINNNLISQHKYQHSQTIQSPPYSLTNIPQENKLTNQKIKKESLSTKKQSNTSTKTSQQNTGTFVCPACTKAYSTDYSLKRHKNVCPALNPGKLQTEKKGNTSRKRKINNVNVATSSTNNNNNDESGSIKNTKADEPHQIDPDSTMNESPPDNAGGSNSLINARRISVNGTSTNNSTIGNNNNGDNAEEQNKSLQIQMATVIQL